GDGADDLGEGRVVEGEGDGMRVGGAGLQHRHVAGRLHAAHQAQRQHHLPDRVGGRGVGVLGQRVDQPAVAAHPHHAQPVEVARHRRLGDVVATPCQQPLQLQLRRDLVLVEQLGDRLLSFVHAVTIVSAPIRTRRTPSASAASPASSLGIMPPVMLPDATSCAAEAAVTRRITSPPGPNSPGTSDRKISSDAPSAPATAAAALSALTLSPEALGAITGTIPPASNARTPICSTEVMRPTRPSLLSPHGSAVNASRIGRQGRPSARSSPHSAALASATAASTTRITASSVTRWPPTKRGSSPAAMQPAVIWGPAPCTTATWRPARASAATCAAAPGAVPPTLTTAIMSCSRC